MRKINIKIIVSVLLVTLGILFFSLGVQKYQVITGSRAALSLPQCEIPDGESTPTNLPCSSCNIQDGSINDDGSTTVDFSCQVVCNAGDNPLDTTDCPSDALPYNIDETSWYWCRASGDHACTAQNEVTDDLLTKVEGTGFQEGGPWILAQQGETEFNANFTVPGFQNCGRVQVDVTTNQSYSYVIDTGNDCDSSLTAQDVNLGGNPTPTYGFGFISQTPSNTPMVPQPTIPPTNTKTPTPSLTSTPIVTNTPIPTTTVNITGTITPTISTTPATTGTVTPTGTLTVSPSPSPTMTNTPTPTLTPIPTATNTPVPPTLTPTPISHISVDGQSPGGEAWFMMLIPAGLVMLGLLL